MSSIMKFPTKSTYRPHIRPTCRPRPICYQREPKRTCCSL